MTIKEKANRNIGLTFDFLRHIIRNPDTLNDIPNGSVLEFIDKDFPVKEKKQEVKKVANKKYIKVKSQLEVI